MQQPAGVQPLLSCLLVSVVLLLVLLLEGKHSAKLAWRILQYNSSIEEVERSLHSLQSSNPYNQSVWSSLMDACPFPGCGRKFPRVPWHETHAYIPDFNTSVGIVLGAGMNENHVVNGVKRGKPYTGRSYFEAMDGDEQAFMNLYLGLSWNLLGGIGPVWNPLEAIGVVWNLLGAIGEIFDEIHFLYADWRNGEPDFQWLSYHVNWLSRSLWKIQKVVPDEHLRKLTEELGTMAKELQVAPKRELYYTMPRLRHLP